MPSQLDTLDIGAANQPTAYSYINEMNPEASLQEPIVATSYGVYTPSLRLGRKRLEIGYYPPLIGIQLIRCSSKQELMATQGGALTQLGLSLYYPD